MLFESMSQNRQFFFRLQTIKQMETSDNGMNRPRTSRQNVLQTTVCAARKQQTIDIQSQFVTEIVVDKNAIGVLHIEILISFGHRMVLRDTSYYMDVLCYCAGPVYQDESVSVNHWPLRSNTMEIPSLGKELTTHSIWRDENLSLSITFN